MAQLSRRLVLLSGATVAVWPLEAFATQPRQIGWDDLIPPGVPYGEIVGPGQIDTENDIWLPQFDENAVKLNMELDGATVRMPGYVIPMELEGTGTSIFLLVPYVGACIHVPPPPPNQLVLVTTDTPWESTTLWEAVWVTGKLLAQPRSTEIAEAGYHMEAITIEPFE